jgi:hypothetical protein
MNQHVTPWLGAYHDGELKGFRLRQVEAHLAQCAACRVELEKLQALGALLQESPGATGLMPPDRFVAQVGLRLPRRPTEPTWKRALETGWRLVPAGLLGAWAFVQTAFIVASIVMIALYAGAGGTAWGLLPESHQQTWLTEALGFSGVSLSDTAREVLQLMGGLGWSTALYFSALAAIGLLYWSWLASLWARRRHRELTLAS